MPCNAYETLPKWRGELWKGKQQIKPLRTLPYVSLASHPRHIRNPQSNSLSSFSTGRECMALAFASFAAPLRSALHSPLNLRFPALSPPLHPGIRESTCKVHLPLSSQGDKQVIPLIWEGLRRAVCVLRFGYCSVSMRFLCFPMQLFPSLPFPYTSLSSLFRFFFDFIC